MSETSAAKEFWFAETLQLKLPINPKKNSSLVSFCIRKKDSLEKTFPTEKNGTFHKQFSHRYSIVNYVSDRYKDIYVLL